MTAFRSSGDPKTADLVIHRYAFESLNGEGWAIFLLGSDGTFTAHSDFGDYTYWWSAMGTTDIRTFLLRWEKSGTYFTDKLSHGDRVYDGATSAANIRRFVCEQRREKSLTREQARDEWNLVESCEVSHSEEGFRAWYEQTDLDDTEGCGLAAYMIAPMLTTFVRETVLGRLLPTIRAELAEEAASSLAQAFAPPAVHIEVSHG